jgi:hypothetical protein
MKPKFQFFLALVFYIAMVRLLHGQLIMFGGIEITESKFSNLIIEFKKLNVSHDSLDEVIERLGPPRERTRNENGESIKYSFKIVPDHIPDERSEINQKIEKLAARRSYLNHTAMLSKSNLQRSTINEELRKNGEENFKLHTDLNTLIANPLQVNCIIDFNINGIINLIKVEKITPDGTEVVYSKISEEFKDDHRSEVSGQFVLQLSTLSEHPPNPLAGHLYLNTSDGHFYGWNGKEWRQLDNASGGRFLK